MSIDQILAIGDAFRKERPLPGSPDMIQRIDTIVEAYNSIKDLRLSDNDERKDLEIYVLNLAREIKRDFLNKDYARLSRKRFLYK